MKPFTVEVTKMEYAMLLKALISQGSELIRIINTTKNEAKRLHALQEVERVDLFRKKLAYAAAGEEMPKENEI